MTSKQTEMLIAFERDGEAADLDDYNGMFGWENRERVINALHKKGFLGEDGITPAGRKAIGK